MPFDPSQLTDEQLQAQLHAYEASKLSDEQLAAQLNSLPQGPSGASALPDGKVTAQPRAMDGAPEWVRSSAKGLRAVGPYAGAAGLGALAGGTAFPVIGAPAGALMGLGAKGVYDLGSGGLNLAFKGVEAIGGPRIEPIMGSNEVSDALFDRLGVPRSETQSEKSVENIGRGLMSGFEGAGMGKILSSLPVGPTAQKIGKEMGNDLGKQVLGGGAGAALVEQFDPHHKSPLADVGLMLFGGASPFVGSGLKNALVGATKNPSLDAAQAEAIARRATLSDNPLSVQTPQEIARTVAATQAQNPLAAGLRALLSLENPIQAARQAASSQTARRTILENVPDTQAGIQRLEAGAPLEVNGYQPSSDVLSPDTPALAARSANSPAGLALNRQNVDALTSEMSRLHAPINEVATPTITSEVPPSGRPRLTSAAEREVGMVTAPAEGARPSSPGVTDMTITPVQGRLASAAEREAQAITAPAREAAAQTSANLETSVQGRQQATTNFEAQAARSDAELRRLVQEEMAAAENLRVKKEAEVKQQEAAAGNARTSEEELSAWAAKEADLKNKITEPAASTVGIEASEAARPIITKNAEAATAQYKEAGPSNTQRGVGSERIQKAIQDITDETLLTPTDEVHPWIKKLQESEPIKDGSLTLDGADRLIKLINSHMRDLGKSGNMGDTVTSKRIGDLKEAVIKQVENAPGSEELQAQRKLWAERQRTFEDNNAGDLFNRGKNGAADKVASEQTLNGFIGSDKGTKQGAEQLAKMGQGDPQFVEAVRQKFLNRVASENRTNPTAEGLTIWLEKNGHLFPEEFSGVKQEIVNLRNRLRNVETRRELTKGEFDGWMKAAKATSPDVAVAKEQLSAASSATRGAKSSPDKIAANDARKVAGDKLAEAKRAHRETTRALAEAEARAADLPSAAIANEATRKAGIDATLRDPKRTDALLASLQGDAAALEDVRNQVKEAFNARGRTRGERVNTPNTKIAPDIDDLNLSNAKILDALTDKVQRRNLEAILGSDHVTRVELLSKQLRVELRRTTAGQTVADTNTAARKTADVVSKLPGGSLGSRVYKAATNLLSDPRQVQEFMNDAYFNPKLMVEIYKTQKTKDLTGVSDIIKTWGSRARKVGRTIPILNRDKEDRSDLPEKKP